MIKLVFYADVILFGVSSPIGKLNPLTYAC